MSSGIAGIFLTLLSVAVLSKTALAEDIQRLPVIGEPVASGWFDKLREPSGVTRLDARTLIVVEDEARRALWRLTLDSEDPATVRFEESEQPTARGFIQRRLLAPLDDLEGVARLSSNRFFIIGSHENASRGARPAREKLVLLTRDGHDIISARLRQDLFDQLTRQYPELADIVDGSKKGKRRALNIEGLAYDRKRGTLLIGLRTPLLEENAIIFALGNAVDYIEGAVPRFAESMKLVDFDSNGIRAMTYDDQSDTLLIISKPESGKKNRSTLWALAATLDAQPVAYKSDDKNLFEDVEGLTPIQGGVLFVRDNGGKKSKANDQWFILKRSQLGLNN